MGRNRHVLGSVGRCSNGGAALSRKPVFQPGRSPRELVIGGAGSARDL